MIADVDPVRYSEEDGCWIVYFSDDEIYEFGTEKEARDFYTSCAEAEGDSVWDYY